MTDKQNDSGLEPQNHDDLAAIQNWLRQNAKFLAVYICLTVTVLLACGRFAFHFSTSFRNGTLDIGTLFSLSGIIGLIGACCYLAVTLTGHYRKEFQNRSTDILSRWLPWYFLEPIIGWLAGYAACALILFFMSTIAGDQLTLTSTVSFPKFLIIMGCAALSGLKGTSLFRTSEDHQQNQRPRITPALLEIIRPSAATTKKNAPNEPQANTAASPAPQTSPAAANHSPLASLDDDQLRRAILGILQEELHNMDKEAPPSPKKSA